VVRVFVERGLQAAAEAATQAAPDTFVGHETVEGVMDEIRKKQQ
jgi:hypothetical protein